MPIFLTDELNQFICLGQVLIVQIESYFEFQFRFFLIFLIIDQ